MAVSASVKEYFPGCDVKQLITRVSETVEGYRKTVTCGDVKIGSSVYKVSLLGELLQIPGVMLRFADQDAGNVIFPMWKLQKFQFQSGESTFECAPDVSAVAEKMQAIYEGKAGLA